MRLTLHCGEDSAPWFTKYGVSATVLKDVERQIMTLYKKKDVGSSTPSKASTMMPATPHLNSSASASRGRLSIPLTRDASSSAYAGNGQIGNGLQTSEQKEISSQVDMMPSEVATEDVPPGCGAESTKQQPVNSGSQYDHFQEPASDESVILEAELQQEVDMDLDDGTPIKVVKPQGKILDGGVVQVSLICNMVQNTSLPGDGLAHLSSDGNVQWHLKQHALDLEGEQAQKKARIELNKSMGKLAC
eukprot:TRINITY_DN2315_c0_g1_i2.p1 TRINITY_DN2315_c0_g1~~TRINITY_DN2315_c0_g1_i2.p1  ORF type:complete len:246 (-),score=36.56 TRINITY_DN2315_c0_g1_i2:88-825(-)